MSTLLAVVAHPDDETFGMGGTLALYAARGVRVELVCATRGEAGEVRPEQLGVHATIAALREAELRCAADILGISQVHFLDYHDSGLHNTPPSRDPRALINILPEELGQRMAGLIRETRPQVVITHDPVGGYFHPDHIILHRAVKAAFDVVREEDGETAPRKLYFSTIPRTLLTWWVRVMPLLGQDPRHFGLNRDIDLLRIVETRIPIHARIDVTTTAVIKDLASACHASQGGRKVNRGVSGLLRGWSRNTEVYMRGFPGGNRSVQETDLFEGIPEGPRPKKSG